MKPDNTFVIAIGYRLGEQRVSHGFAAGLLGTVVAVEQLNMAHRWGNSEVQR